MPNRIAPAIAALFALQLMGAEPYPAPSADGAENKNSVAIEALSRLKGMDLEAKPALKAAVLRVAESVKGSAQFMELVRDFKLKDQEPALLDFALKHPDDSAGVEALRMVAAEKLDLVKAALATTNAAAAITLLGNTADKRFLPLLEPVVTRTDANAATRRNAVKALAQTQEGAAFLLALAREEKLPPDLKFAATVELNNARWPEIKKGAAEVLPLPQGQNAQPLPPISQLVKLRGETKRGEAVFSRPEVGCSNCHQINGKGNDFGPKLSEIGSKLGKDALYESILDPSAGISFGYEAWQIELKDGEEAFGIVASETNEDIVVKTQNGISTRYKKTQIAKREKKTLSIMPAGLQLAMSAQDLVDLVEYLATLKKPGTPQ